MNPISGAAWQHSIGDLFLRTAAAYPRQTAVQCGDERLSYDDLRSAALRLAQTIVEQDLGGTGPVAVLLGHGIEAVVAMMAALVAGRSYAAFDPAMPAAVLCSQLDDLAPSLLITDRQRRALVEGLRSAGSCLHRVLFYDQAGQTETLQPCSNPNALATILYTSGSTGQPKGIMHTHRTLLRHVAYVNEVSAITAQDCIIALHPLHLGLSQARVLGALVAGARLLLYDASAHGISALGDVLEREDVTVLATVPALFRSLCHSFAEGRVLSGVRLVQVGAATVRWADVAMFKQHFSSAAVFRLVYAASEVLGCSELFLSHATEEISDPLPVGRAVEGKQIVIVDADHRLVPAGESGEIAVRSEFLSPGYWRKPEATAQRFLPDPEGGDCRIYLTGDRGRLRPDGMLEHLGRQDLMVKIAGHRIELETVERALRQVDGVTDAAVIARSDGRLGQDRNNGNSTRQGAPGEDGAGGGDKHLVAYIVRDGAVAGLGDQTSSEGYMASPTVSSLRRALAERLPDYMIPAIFVVLPSLPFNAAGKIDRDALAALPPPHRMRPELDVPFRAPSGAVETRIAAIWEDVLGIDGVGVDDSFLDLGGNSILAARIAAGVLRDPAMSHRAGLDQSISPATLFAAPTVAAMAALMQVNDSAGRLEALLAELEALSEEEAEGAMRHSAPRNTAAMGVTRP